MKITKFSIIMNQIKREMQEKLKEALQTIPPQRIIPVSKYLQKMCFLFYQFQNEVETNIRKSTSASKTIQYLTKLKVDFEGQFMLFESSFELLLFPDDDLLFKRGNEIINTHHKAHLKIFNQISSFLTFQIDTIKFLVKHKLYPEIIKMMPSKYILDKKKAAMIDIVEFAYALYNLDFFYKRDGGFKQLYEFIQDVGSCFGEEIGNISSRIRELKQRNNQKSRFLNKMMVSYVRAIDTEK